ncbi:hypothetical protein [Natronorubrum daqingense]|uniref:Uncharacterized protein n=1 Tax=Natronorubrum daqingense TaxID=588898 RepID=A0A1N7CEC0_9EURY|nr:hypothetical protein [Natronorubrum daqingense]APX96861.1 hypothetical protein BB347_09645 [Natronorubrum daqingense]SIR61883.1 hypothetical protein SAMN05421809_1654 [Natronorubrum daqingense]
MSEPDREPTETPTTSKEEAEEEGQEMARNWIGIAVVSIFALLLIVIAAMQFTGVVDVFAPIADTEGQQWGVFFVLALIVLIVGGWSWKAIIS